MSRQEPRSKARCCALFSTALFVLLNSTHESAAENAEPGHAHAHEHSHGDEHEDTERIVVTPTPLAHSVDELALPVVRLEREEILDDLRFTLGETVSKTPGVTNSGFTAGAARPVIRGQDAFRTDVLEDGLSTQDVSRLSPDHAVPVNPMSARSIEIVRGPAVLRYGGGASAGVVNALTNRVPSERIDELVTGDLVGIYGNNGNEADFEGLLEGGVGGFAWHLDGLYRRSGDYTTGAGTKQNGSNTESWALSPGASYVWDEARLGFAYIHYDSDYGIPEDEPVQIDMRTNRYRFDGDYDDPVKGVRKVRLRGVYSDYRHDEIADGVVGQTFRNGEFDGRLETLHDPLFGFVGAIGMHGRSQNLVAAGEAEEFLAPTDTTMFAVYLFEERSFGEHYDVQLGFRGEGNWVSGTPFMSGQVRNRSFAPMSGSIALLAHPADAWTIGLTGSASQRAPAQVELFARGPHEATSTFEIGDPNLDEETSYTGELRVSGSIDRVKIDGSVFATFYDDYIFGQETGVLVNEEGMVDPDGDLEQLFYLERNSLFYGGELTLSADLVDFWGGTFGTDWQIDFVRARFTQGEGGRNVPRIPPMRWGGSVFYKHERVTGRFGFLRNEAQWHPAPDEFATDAFTMLDLTLRVPLPFFEERAPSELLFTASNLLDVRARNAVSFTKEEVLLPGRSFRFALRTQF